MATVLIDKLLQAAIKQGVSDIHIVVGQPPVFRLHGRMRKLETKTLEGEDAVALMKSITPERCQRELQESGSTDFGFAFGDAARFRVSVFKQRGFISMVLRQIPNDKLTPEQLGLPEAVVKMVHRPRGLFLVTGPTGSGKSTTLASLINLLNETLDHHIITIEDPIEYELRYATQWQVRPGMEGGAFADLIRASMRHDPDYIIIGEMRDAATVETSLKAAESGHTVISTIHADTALQTFERLRSLMPSERERSSTYTLAQQVRCILNQRLVRTLCQGCAHKDSVTSVLKKHEIEQLGLADDIIVRRHNASGCDLCNRTGISGRTLLLDALMITLGPAQRNEVYEALIGNVNNIINEDGVIVHTRREGLTDLVTTGLVDPKAALSYLEQ